MSAFRDARVILFRDIGVLSEASRAEYVTSDGVDKYPPIQGAYEFTAGVSNFSFKLLFFSLKNITTINLTFKNNLTKAAETYSSEILIHD